MEKVQIIPPPKEVDPRVLAWKGAAVLGKMDSVSELWVNRMGDEGEKKRVRDVPVRQGCGRRANARGEY